MLFIILFGPISTFLRHDSIIDVVPNIDEFQKVIQKSKRLQKAREIVKRAKDSKLGIFNTNNPLKLLPFELRYLARRSIPDRHVLDLSDNKPKLLKPTKYYKIENVEDRLFIPEEYVPLFQKHGFKTK